MTASEILVLAGWGVLGLALGLLHFRALRANVALYQREGAGWRPFAVHGARLVLLGIILWMVATRGGGPLIAVAIGFVLARPVAMRLDRRQEEKEAS